MTQTIQVKIDAPVDYTGCKSEQERAQVRVQAKRKMRRQIAAQPFLLAALEDLIYQAGQVCYSCGSWMDTEQAEAAIAKATQ